MYQWLVQINVTNINSTVVVKQLISTKYFTIHIEFTTSLVHFNLKYPSHKLGTSVLNIYVKFLWFPCLSNICLHKQISAVIFTIIYNSTATTQNIEACFCQVNQRYLLLAIYIVHYHKCETNNTKTQSRSFPPSLEVDFPANS